MRLFEVNFQASHLVVMVLLFMLIEWLVIAFVHRRASKQLALMLAAGAFLMLAMLAALQQADWPIVGSLLALGGMAHLIDLKQRLPQLKGLRP